jgi:catechol 2,3-dioxygenase-like lactoylglutathione lyase family enzyme
MSTGGEYDMTNELVSVRYMVDDVDESIDFYTRHFGFEPGHNASRVRGSHPRASAAAARGAAELGRAPDA